MISKKLAFKKIGKHIAKIGGEDPAIIIIENGVLNFKNKKTGKVEAVDVPPALDKLREILKMFKGAEFQSLAVETFDDGSFEYLLKYKDGGGELITDFEKVKKQ